MSEKVCPCSICVRCRRLESKLAIAREVIAGRKPFVIGLDGALFPDDREELEAMIADIDEAIAALRASGHNWTPRRRRRSIGKFMARDRIQPFMGAR
jgi:hypothetical protein